MSARSPDTVDVALGYALKELSRQGKSIEEVLSHLTRVEAEERLMPEAEQAEDLEHLQVQAAWSYTQEDEDRAMTEQAEELEREREDCYRSAQEDRIDTEKGGNVDETHRQGKRGPGSHSASLRDRHRARGDCEGHHPPAGRAE